MKAPLVIAFCWSVFLAAAAGPLWSQPAAGAVCRPLSERKTEVGCWILANDSVGVLSEPQVFWRLDTYQTRAAALAVKGERSTVVEALGKVWLLSIGPAGGRAAGAERVAEIGPIPIHAGDAYSAQYMEAVFDGHRGAALAGAHPARRLEAGNHDGARLDAQGTVPAVTAKMGRPRSSRRPVSERAICRR